MRPLAVGASDRRLLYSPQRALDTLLTIREQTPTRCFSVLFPLWEIETEGIQQHSQPYELLDRFLERGIAEGHLRSIKHLVRFFGLDHQETLVGKSIDYLRTIGHVCGDDGELMLTELGRQSLAAGISYRNTHSRRKLYFDS